MKKIILLVILPLWVRTQEQQSLLGKRKSADNAQVSIAKVSCALPDDICRMVNELPYTYIETLDTKNYPCPELELDEVDLGCLFSILETKDQKAIADFIIAHPTKKERLLRFAIEWAQQSGNTGLQETMFYLLNPTEFNAAKFNSKYLLRVLLGRSLKINSMDDLATFFSTK